MPMGVRATALLDMWEHGREASPGERALALLELAETREGREALARWTVGRRDAALLAFRERLFGPTFSALADCPRCGEVLEMEFPASSVAPSPPTGDGGAACSGDRVFEHEADGHRIRYRLPTAGDLAELRHHDGEAAAWLLERCVVAVDHVAGSAPGFSRPVSADCGGSVTTEDATCPRTGEAGPDGDGAPGLRALGPVAREALETALARTVADWDPQADIELALTCPACGAQWRTPFDITAFLWRELEAWAMRTLRETHLLATAYGWSEEDILALSAWRRQHYIGLIGDGAP